ncbi:MAG: hypothetical protein D3926_23700 [Desulfobacteraceae bacterium]|nr:MAG: hypothetical protein D3926_23700 [Desulfobacteraceae bacterium]
MNRAITVSFFWIIALLSAGSNAFSGSTATLVYQNEHKVEAARIPAGDMYRYGTTLKALDPNFKTLGVRQYTGIEIKTLLNMADPGVLVRLSGDGITIVGKDQYVGYIPFSMLMDSKIMLVWEADSKPIPAVNGGPLKMMYPDDVRADPNSYTWYVDTIFAGTLEDPRLDLMNSNTRIPLSFKTLQAMSQPVPKIYVSKPPGYRPPSRGIQDSYSAVPLSRIVEKVSCHTCTRIEFTPWVGSGVSIDLELALDRLLILVSISGRAVHPMDGGPFSVIFPVELHNELSAQTPESGALFFLKQITLR